MVTPLHEATFGSTRQAVLMLTAAVALVLLMACTNVAGLLLARGAARDQEMAIRNALGGSRWRLFQQLFTENLVLSVAGGAAGLLLAAWGTWILVDVIPPSLPRGNEIGVDWAVLAFSVSTTFATSLIIGIVPAWRSAKPTAVGVLKIGAGATDGRGWLRGLLLTAQTFTVVVLLVGAGLFLNSVWRLTHTELGFDTRNVATVFVAFKGESCGPDRREAFRADFLSRALALPGVVEASTTSDLPFSTGGMVGFQLPGKSAANSAELYIVDYRYLPLMQYPLKKGRLLARTDRRGGFVAIVNEAFADQFFPGADALGQRITVKDAYEIVGVVGNHRELLSRRRGTGVRNLRHTAVSGPTLRAIALPAIYIPSAQADFSWCTLYLVARTGPDPRTLFPAMKAQAAAVDPKQAVMEMATLDEWASAPSTPTRFYAVALLMFALVAAVLGAVGIYGVLAQTVARRVREIGVRMALGATSGRVALFVTVNVLAFVGVGIAVGLAGAYVFARILSSFLFDLTPGDPATYAVVVAVLVAVGTASAYLPVRRAVRIDPMAALRWE